MIHHQLTPNRQTQISRYFAVQIQINPKSQFEFVPRDTKESAFLDWVGFGDVAFVAFSVETVILERSCDMSGHVTELSHAHCSTLQHTAAHCSTLIECCVLSAAHYGAAHYKPYPLLSSAEYDLFYRALLQNIVSFIGLFCKRDLSFQGAYKS